MHRYQAIDAGLIRLSAPAPGPFSWPDLTTTGPEQVDGWRRWLEQVWAEEATVEAIETASPALASRVADVRAGRLARPRRVRRVVESVVRYLLRYHRATPFGWFAGVAPVLLGESARVTTEDPPAVAARPGAPWVDAVITELENDPRVLMELRVVANNLGFARDGRWVLPWHPRPGETTTESNLGEVSIRRSRPVQLALEAARSPIAVNALVDELASHLPGSSREGLLGLVNGLVAHRALISDLRPPMQVTDPLSHLITRLEKAGPGGDSERRRQELSAVRDLLNRFAETPGPAGRRAMRTEAITRMATLGSAPHIDVDLRLGERVQLPRPVVREAEAAASALVALARHPAGTPPWRTYHARFLDHYGSGAVVPLTEITDPAAGLGFPAGYRGSTPPVPDTVFSARDAALLRLAHTAALEGHREVVLDEKRLGELAAATGVHGPPVPHTELRFHLHATCPHGVDRGAFVLGVEGASRQAGALNGRFLHLLAEPDRSRITTNLAALGGAAPDARTAQVSCPPLSGRIQHLARTPPVWPRISLGEHPDDNATGIDVGDLAVTGDEHRLWLVSLQDGRPVEPVMANAVAMRHATQPLARFLCEITTSRSAPCRPFDWGPAASALEFLPRLRYRRSVLAPARWTLRSESLPGADAPWPQWHQTWDRLRHRVRLDRLVLLEEGDRRLRLDLDEHAHLALLRQHLDRTSTADLTEAPPDDAFGWIGGRAHEIVMPMATAPPQPRLPSETRPVRPLRHPGHHPGTGAWVYARLHTHPGHHDAILTGHLPELLEQWTHGPPDMAWFVRYRDPDPHLRLRLCLHDPSHYGAAAQDLGAWADQLRNRGLLAAMVLDVYRPEVGRFGDGLSLDAAEAVFAADSAAAIAQLRTAAQAGLDLRALAAASMIDLAAGLTGGHRQGRDWLVDHPPKRPAAPPPREVADQTRELADPDRALGRLAEPPGGTALVGAWRQRRAAATAYRARLTAEGPNPDRVVSDLLHLHHNRVFGPDRETERACLRLARAAALALNAREERRTPSPP